MHPSPGPAGPIRRSFCTDMHLLRRPRGIIVARTGRLRLYSWLSPRHVQAGDTLRLLMTCRTFYGSTKFRGCIAGCKARPPASPLIQPGTASHRSLHRLGVRGIGPNGVKCWTIPTWTLICSMIPRIHAAKDTELSVICSMASSTI